MFRRLKSVVLEFSWNPLAKFSWSQNATPPPASCGQGRAGSQGTSGGRRTWAGTRGDGLAAPPSAEILVDCRLFVTMCTEDKRTSWFGARVPLCIAHHHCCLL